MKMSLFSEVSTSCVDFPLISPLMSPPAKHMRFGCMVSGKCWCMGVQLHGFHGCQCMCVRLHCFRWVSVCVCAVAWLPLGVGACVRSRTVFRPGDASASLGFLPFHFFCVCFSAVANT